MKLSYEEHKRCYLRSNDVFFYYIDYGDFTTMKVHSFIYESKIVTDVYHVGKMFRYTYDGSFHLQRGDFSITLDKNNVKNTIIELFKESFFKNSSKPEKVIDHNHIDNHEIWDIITTRIEKNYEISSVMGT